MAICCHHYQKAFTEDIGAPVQVDLRTTILIWSELRRMCPTRLAYEETSRILRGDIWSCGIAQYHHGVEPGVFIQSITIRWSHETTVVPSLRQSFLDGHLIGIKFLDHGLLPNVIAMMYRPRVLSDCQTSYLGDMVYPAEWNGVRKLDKISHIFLKTYTISQVLFMLRCQTYIPHSNAEFFPFSSWRRDQRRRVRKWSLLSYPYSKWLPINASLLQTTRLQAMDL